MPPPAFDHAACVVIDLLQDYFDAHLWPASRIPAARDRLAARTNELTAWCRQRGIPVIWVRQAFQPDLSDAFPHMRRSDRRYTIRGTPGCELLPELDTAPDDSVVFKTRFSAFFRTDLDAVLDRLQAHTLILAGITTAWCVRATAVDAYQRDYAVVLARDCLEAFTQADHEESLRAMDGYLGLAYANAELFDLNATWSPNTGTPTSR